MAVTGLLKREPLKRILLEVLFKSALKIAPENVEVAVLEIFINPPVLLLIVPAENVADPETVRVWAAMSRESALMVKLVTVLLESNKRLCDPVEIVILSEE